VKVIDFFVAATVANARSEVPAIAKNGYIYLFFYIYLYLTQDVPHFQEKANGII